MSNYIITANCEGKMMDTNHMFSRVGRIDTIQLAPKQQNISNIGTLLFFWEENGKDAKFAKSFQTWN